MNPTVQDYLATASALGFELPSLWYIVGALLFSTLGYIVYRRGRREHNTPLVALGVALMLFTYVVSSTLLVFLIGTCLCVAAWCAHVSGNGD